MSSLPRTIDIHAHAAVPAAMRLLEGQPGLAAQQRREREWFGEAALDVNQRLVSRVRPLLTDTARRLEAMDRCGIDMQLVAPMALPHTWADETLADSYVAATNSAIAELVSTGSPRLLGLGTVALQHPALAVRQLQCARTELGLRGVQIVTRAGDCELDHPGLADFWACAEELDAVVLIHPSDCTLGARLSDYYLANVVGNPLETTIGLSRIIFSGLLDRHSSLKIVAVHGGGYLPAYVARSDHAWQVRPDAHTCAEPPSHYLRRLWFDSLVYTPAALRGLIDAVGTDRVLLGSDYPFDMGVDDPVARVSAAGLDTVHVTAIVGGNAARLLAQRTRPAPR